MEPSWSLHLLSEILSAFSTDDPENLRNVINRVAEAVDAEVTAILDIKEVRWGIGLPEHEWLAVQQLLGQKPPTITIPAGTMHAIWAPMGEGTVLLVCRLGEVFSLEERSLIRAMARSIELCLRMLSAISAERQAKLEASYQACHDPLTGLPNRLLVLERLSHWIACPPSDGAVGTAVLFIDIDRFKWVNDAHGHAVGDELLMHISRLLRAAVRRDDLVGRLSGDEFIVISRARSLDTPTELARRIIQSIRKPFQVGGTELSHSASIGISFASSSDTASSAIENADMAMYHAKAAGRGRFSLFNPSMREDARQRLAIEEQLRHAISDNEINAFLQPVAQLNNRRLIGFEALARWQHPQLGLLAPAGFISAAEECGLIEEIDLRVMQLACQAVGQWQHRDGWQQLRLSVNVSARTLSSASLVEHTQSVLIDSGINPEQLYLEITETALVEDLQATASTLDGLRNLGIKLAIDDFGTGYSSLLYLKRLPVGALKIDRSFVADLGRDAEDEAIVRAVISLADTLGLIAIAEGVELESQESLLMSYGCTLAQGNLYGKPLSIPDTARHFFPSAEDSLMVSSHRHQDT